MKSIMRKVAIKELVTLSRNEKITLVQELWDDIASGKDINDIPLSHRRTLERTLKNITSGKTTFHEWKDVKKKYVPKACSFAVRISDEAIQDIDESYIWYDFQQTGLGEVFANTIDKSFRTISRNPELSAIIFKGLRKYTLPKFPFSIYYKANTKKRCNRNYQDIASQT